MNADCSYCILIDHMLDPSLSAVLFTYSIFNHPSPTVTITSIPLWSFQSSSNCPLMPQYIVYLLSVPLMGSFGARLSCLQLAWSSACPGHISCRFEVVRHSGHSFHSHPSVPYTAKYQSMMLCYAITMKPVIS